MNVCIEAVVMPTKLNLIHKLRLIALKRRYRRVIFLAEGFEDDINVSFMISTRAVFNQFRLLFFLIQNNNF